MNLKSLLYTAIILIALIFAACVGYQQSSGYRQGYGYGLNGGPYRSGYPPSIDRSVYNGGYP